MKDTFNDCWLAVGSIVGAEDHLKWSQSNVLFASKSSLVTPFSVDNHFYLVLGTKVMLHTTNELQDLSTFLGVKFDSAISHNS